MAERPWLGGLHEVRTALIALGLDALAIGTSDIGVVIVRLSGFVAFDPHFKCAVTAERLHSESMWPASRNAA